MHQVSKPPRRYSGYGQNKSYFSKTFTDVESPHGAMTTKWTNDDKNGKIHFQL